MYIIKKQILNKKIDNRFFLKLNRAESKLEIYEKADEEELWNNYPIRKDFSALDYVMFRMVRSLPCIYGGNGEKRTPCGMFCIEKVSHDEYISTYHPQFKEVKFFGYMTVFEDYFIHSDLYSMSANGSNFEEMKPISLGDQHTGGCVRLAQKDLEWLLNNIPVGTMIEL